MALGSAGCASAGSNRGSSSAPVDTYSLSKPWTAWEETGLATYYASSLAGHRTASGERYDPSQLTAAHRRLPFGTLVEVRRRDGKRSVIVRINDRGPYSGANRVIDLSRRAAEALGIVQAGKAMVEIHPYGAPDRNVPPRH
ncbi:MAG TPA: septal ring lytic transglycosylase RlpA family protein [Polyangiaceae bacterium]|nr:septal ring lytic transglycosylase RlpA family protein [Polyangiaceae bacterium]